MASHINFKNSGDPTSNDANNQQPKVGPFRLTRQPSVYSLTFDEFQNTWGGGLGKDFGSMNMDELLKNIWNAEESQSVTTNNNNNNNNDNNNNNNNSNNSLVGAGGNLQRQGSIALPRTLSQKTVDEVWRDLMKETDSGNSNLNVPQRQPTLGEVTLEEFLVRAGLVREDPLPKARPNNSNGGFYGFGNDTNPGLAQNNNGFLCTNPSVNNLPSGVNVNIGGVRPPQPLPQQQESVFTKQANIAFTNPMNLVNSAQLAMQERRSSVTGIGDRSMNTNLFQAVDLKSRITVAVSPGTQISPEMTPKSNTDASSFSPVPFVFGRGRKSSAALEKVVERRQRRMIKNRESAARSRARKQAYTLELEAEVAKLKELNEELQRKQAEIMEMHKNQLLAPMKQPWGCKRRCLRRTVTGPW